MSPKKIIIGILSLLFLMIGADKFLSFLEPPCSMESSIPSTVWSILGVLQLAAGLLIWLPKFRKPLVGFFFIFMLVFATAHLTQGTYDIGGAVLMAALLGLLIWNPSFLQGKEIVS